MMLHIIPKLCAPPGVAENEWAKSATSECYGGVCTDVVWPWPALKWREELEILDKKATGTENCP
jgi:hypothetical protein